MQRILEPEVMDTTDDAADYDAMDHRQVNLCFVHDLLDAVQPAVQAANRKDAQLNAAELRRIPSADDLAAAMVQFLDLGTGTAQIPILLCQQCDVARVVAVDAAESMLDLAIANIDVANLRECIQLDRVDAKELPYDDGQFDVVISNSIVHHIPEPIDVLREAVRVTAPGGWLFFRDLVRPADEATLEQLVDTYAANENDHQRKMFRNSLQAALTPEEMRKLVAELRLPGDDVVRTSDRHWTWCTRLPS